MPVSAYSLVHVNLTQEPLHVYNDTLQNKHFILVLFSHSHAGNKPVFLYLFGEPSVLACSLFPFVFAERQANVIANNKTI